MASKKHGMEQAILRHQNDPNQLEKLYRSDKGRFRQAFQTLYPELKDSPLGKFWHERLAYSADAISWGSRRELLFVIVAALLAGLLAKVPAIFSIDEEFFYSRNLGFIVFPFLSAYFAWKQGLSGSKIGLIAGATLLGLGFINAFPDTPYSDTLTLSCIHLLLFLWSLLGFAFVGQYRNATDKRLDFLKYNGDAVVMTTLILIAGGILSGLTIGLFELIGLQIAQFYMENIAVFGLAAAPIVGTYLTQTNPQLVGKVSPVIARIFSPLVLVMLVVYLLAMAYAGKDPYTDREFLLIFNLLLMGVMAIIFFSIAAESNRSRIEHWTLFLLAVVTVIVNGIALSAILFRISEWGFTPNRTAVLGGNVLILINLLLVTAQLYKANATPAGVGKVIAWYLPLYFLWAVVVSFVFPFVFGFA